VETRFENFPENIGYFRKRKQRGSVERAEYVLQQSLIDALKVEYECKIFSVGSGTYKSFHVMASERFSTRMEDKTLFVKHFKYDEEEQAFKCLKGFIDDFEEKYRLKILLW
jgi:hypothetical protein